MILKTMWESCIYRHVLAPGYGDPANFNILDCKTQRNLNQVGIEQSKAIGNIFNENAY